MMKVLLILVSFVSSLPALAEQLPFTREAFEKAQAEGKNVVLQLHADWCPVCKKQQKAVKSLSEEPKHKETIFFKADFDKEKELKTRLGVKQQSTLIFFNGEKEVSRAQGITDSAAIEEQLQKLREL